MPFAASRAANRDRYPGKAIKHHPLGFKPRWNSSARIGARSENVGHDPSNGSKAKLFRGQTRTSEPFRSNSACCAALFVRSDWVSERPSELHPYSELIP